MNKIILFSILVCLTFGAQAQPMAALMSTLASKSLLTDIVKLNNDKLIAVGDRGHILLSDDGERWQQSPSPVNVLLTDVFFLNEQVGWAVGHDATVIKTVDGGHTWLVQHYSPKIDKPLFGVHFKTSNDGFAFGAYGLFLRTSDGGKSWQKEFHGELLHPDDLAYVSELKDSDPQAYEDETSSILPHFNRVLIDENHAYLAGEVGLFAISTDYGRHWQKVEPFYNGSFFDVASVTKADGEQMFVSGLRGHLFTAVADANEGASWQEVNIGVKSSVNRIITSKDKLILIGNAGLLLVSSDGGKQYQSHIQSDGKALTSGVMVKNKLVLTSQVGIKVIDGGRF